MRLILISSLLVSQIAVAQNLSLSLADATFGPKDCGSTVSVTYEANTGGLSDTQLCSDFRIWATTGSCGDAPASGEKELTLSTSWPSAKTGTASIPFNNLFPLQSKNCGESLTQQLNICGSYRYVSSTSCSGTGTQVVRATAAKLTYDGEPPERPTIDKILARDGGLTVHVSAPGAARVFVEYRQAESNAAYQAGGQYNTSQSSSARISGLTNGTEYEVVAKSEDDALNQSQPSDPKRGKPVPTEGFFESYQKAGGEEQGGCSVSSGAWLWGLIGLWPWLVRRSLRR